MPIFSLYESQYLRLLKYKLWVKDPHCIFCGVETILSDKKDKVKGKGAPLHMATIDHKYSKLNPLRDIVKQEYQLCCNLCNNYKAQIEEDKLPLEELQKRSRKGFERTKIIKPKAVYVKSIYNPKTGKGKLLENGKEVPLTHIPATTVNIKSPFILFTKWVKKTLLPSLPFQK